MEVLLYGTIGLIVSVVMICLAYYTPRFIIGKDVKYYQPKIWLDKKMPFINWFVIFYIATYLIVIVAPFAIVAFGGELALVKWLICLGVFSVVCFLTYIFFPTICPRDEKSKKLKDGSIFDKGVAFIYRHDDPPISCLPSFHNGFVWLLFVFYIINFDNVNVVAAVVLGVFCIAVSLSTLFIRQHYIADAATAIILVLLIAVSISQFVFIG